MLVLNLNLIKNTVCLMVLFISFTAASLANADGPMAQSDDFYEDIRSFYPLYRAAKYAFPPGPYRIDDELIFADALGWYDENLRQIFYSNYDYDKPLGENALISFAAYLENKYENAPGQLGKYIRIYIKSHQLPRREEEDFNEIWTYEGSNMLYQQALRGFFSYMQYLFYLLGKMGPDGIEQSLLLIEDGYQNRCVVLMEYIWDSAGDQAAEYFETMYHPEVYSRSTNALVEYWKTLWSEGERRLFY